MQLPVEVRGDQHGDDAAPDGETRFEVVKLSQLNEVEREYALRMRQV